MIPKLIYFVLFPLRFLVIILVDFTRELFLFFIHIYSIWYFCYYNMCLFFCFNACLLLYLCIKLLLGCGLFGLLINIIMCFNYVNNLESDVLVLILVKLLSSVRTYTCYTSRKNETNTSASYGTMSSDDGETRRNLCTSTEVVLEWWVR